MTPPTLVLSIADSKSSFWICEFLYISNSSLLALMEGSFEMMPRPVQGASNSTRSNELGNILEYLRPSRQVTVVLVTPKRYKLNCKAFNLSFFKSLAKIQPVFFIS